MIPDDMKLRDPWLVAVWPGMGHVALTAGYYLLAKLGMYLVAELSPRDLFDIEHVEVRDGVIRSARMPRSRLFVWKDPEQKHDLLLFIGEAQPPAGKYAFCRNLIEQAKRSGARRVFTFAAMATPMHPAQEPRVFGVTTDASGLGELRQLELSLLEDGHISGLNGVLLGVAAEEGLQGTGLLGEIPQIFSQFTFPRASLAVLRVFNAIAGLDLDFTELIAQAAAADEQLGNLLLHLQQRLAQQTEPPAQEPFRPESSEQGQLSSDDQKRIEHLFREAAQDRARAYELKNELDRLGVYRQYEDRFLDLFRQSER